MLASFLLDIALGSVKAQPEEEAPLD